MMGVTVVGDFSSGTFTCKELLAQQLASCTVLESAAPLSMLSQSVSKS